MSEKNIKVTEVTLEQAEVTDEMADWQPISSAPRNGKVVDLWAGDERLANCFWLDYRDGFPEDSHWRQQYAEMSGANFGIQDINPTHWMLLPKPPA